MADVRAQEMRQNDDDALLVLLRESKEELFNLRFQVATGQLDNNRRLQTVRRDIARIYTVMRERELGIDRSAGDGSSTTTKASATNPADAPVTAEVSA